MYKELSDTHMTIGIEKNEVEAVGEEMNQLLLKKETHRKAIVYFYGEIMRLKKGEERKYQFPITLETCMETISQCYEYISTLEELRNINPEDSDEYDIEIATTNVSLSQIEEYSHTLEQNKPVEILTDGQALPVIPQNAEETKGTRKKKFVVRDTAGNPAPEIKPLVDEKRADEGTVESVVNGRDVSKEELYQVQDIVKDEKEPGITPVTEVIAEEEPVTKKETITEEKETDDSLAIEQPKEDDEVNLKVVVEPEKPEIPPIATIEPYVKDNVPMLTNEDIIADSQEENIDDIELIVNEEKIDDENESIEELPEELTEYGVKSISRNKTYSFKAKLQKKTIDEKIVSGIKLFPYDENDENLRKAYFESHNNMISAPHVSRVNLIMSGYFVEISSYGNWDTLSLERIMKDKATDFVEKEKAILNSIYDHIVYFSYTQTKPEFEDWLTTVKYPDYEILFYGLFDANYEGINYFRLTCPYCGNNNIIVAKENKDLVVAIDRNYTQNELIEQITTKEMNKLDTKSILPKWANKTKVRVMTQNTKILFEYQVPTLFDYLQMLTTARRISSKDNKPLDLSKILESDSDEYPRLLLYLYIKTIGLPSPVYGNPEKPKEATSYRYIGSDNKADVIETINAIDIEDYSLLLSGEPIRELLTKRSVYYFVKDSKCTNESCGKNIRYVNLDPRAIFFSRITEATRNLYL
jgi:hypothetical protein